MLLRICVLVYPDIEVEAKDLLVWRLADIGVETILIHRNAPIAWHALILLKPNARKEICALRQITRNAARDDGHNHRHKHHISNQPTSHKRLVKLSI